MLPDRIAVLIGRLGQLGHGERRARSVEDGEDLSLRRRRRCRPGRDRTSRPRLFFHGSYRIKCHRQPWQANTYARTDALHAQADAAR